MKVIPEVYEGDELCNNTKIESFVKNSGIHSDGLVTSRFLKPDSSLASDFFNTVRFTRPLMMNRLKSFISNVERTPIENYEIDLYNMTQVFVSNIFAKEIDIHCVEKIHHILKINQHKLDVSSLSELNVKAKLDNIMKLYPFVTVQYELFCKLILLFNALLVKWKIGTFKNYDYRYTGRVLNVQILDLLDINSGFFNIDVFWISSKIFTPPLDKLGSPKLLQMAKVLHDQVKRCFNTFLYLNPKRFDSDYIIENNLAYKSRSFFNWARDILPEISLSYYKHTELSLVNGWTKCFKNSNPKIENAFDELQDLEFSYRNFEKELIGNILDLTGKDNF